LIRGKEEGRPWLVGQEEEEEEVEMALSAGTPTLRAFEERLHELGAQYRRFPDPELAR
jgi:hypothetical protein